MKPTVLKPSRLKITEIFYSIQGESTFSGRPSVFVRLTGCDLRCHWCDSAYTFTGGTWWSLDTIFDAVDAYGCQLVCITGGEPLLQKAVFPLMTGLLDRGYTVTLETGGHRPIEAVDPRVHRIVDLKPPGSGEVSKNRLTNLKALTLRDEVKFVLADRADYEWARTLIQDHQIAEQVAAVLLSSVHGQLPGDRLAAWVLEDHLPVRIQVQLHKIFWGSDVQGV